MRNEIQTISVIGSSIVVAYFITKLLRENRFYIAQVKTIRDICIL